MKKLMKIFVLIIIIIAIGVMSYFYIESINENQIKDYAIREKEIHLYKNEDEAYGSYGGIQLLEYDNSNKDYAEIYFISFDYTTEPGMYYTVEITDESNENLLLDGTDEQKFAGGVVTGAKIKKINLDEKINLTIFEKGRDTNRVFNSVKVQIDLGKDLEEKSNILQQPELWNGNIANINFKYVDSEDVYFSKDTQSEEFYMAAEVQYGSSYINEEFIRILAEKNIMNFNLEEAFKNYKLIFDNMPVYGIRDTYYFDIWSEQDEMCYEVVIDFNEMIDLCNGLTIEKNGKKYTKYDFYVDIENIEEIGQDLIVKDKELEIGKGIKAIKYNMQYDGDIYDEETNYMFVDGEYIYYVTVPQNKKIADVVEQVLESIEFIK